MAIRYRSMESNQSIFIHVKFENIVIIYISASYGSEDFNNIATFDSQLISFEASVLEPIMEPIMEFSTSIFSIKESTYFLLIGFLLFSIS